MTQGLSIFFSVSKTLFVSLISLGSRLFHQIIIFVFFWLPFGWASVDFVTDTFVFLVLLGQMGSPFLIWSFLVRIRQISSGLVLIIFFDWGSSSLRSFISGCFLSVIILIFDTVLVVLGRFLFVSNIVAFFGTILFFGVNGDLNGRQFFLAFAFHFFNLLFESVAEAPFDSAAAEFWIFDVLLFKRVAFYPGHCEEE